MNEKLLMKTALLAGKILMENGAEVYRIEDTMERIIRKGIGDPRMDIYYTHVTLSGLFVRIEDVGTDFRRVEDRTYNLTKTTAVNTLSRAYTAGKIGLTDMYKSLKIVEKEQSKIPEWFKILCAGILSGSIVLIFEGSWWDVFPGGIAGVVAYYVFLRVAGYLKAPFISEYISTFVGGAAGYVTYLLCNGVSLKFAMVGAVVPLVPGITITNSMRDIMARHYLSGMIRFVETFCIAFALGAGIVTVYFILRLVGGEA
ncbi:threonine/serine exporter family protein [Gemella massiliensis]|uniref:threonine/serine ThrE exporter family protein n=1 Tax=Gemella massiliensis TaxID=1909670 RepID=UPI000930C78E|nr:threonine/serine exporter family protein [Gemella massiliensis]